MSIAGEPERSELRLQPHLPRPRLSQWEGQHQPVLNHWDLLDNILFAAFSLQEAVPGEEGRQVCQEDQGEEREAGHLRPAGPDRQGG